MTRYRHLITDANRKWWTLGAMCFALFMIMLDNTVVNVALPSIERDLGASLSSLEWTVNGYTLAFAVLLATGGRLGDIFGRRLTFLVGKPGLDGHSNGAEQIAVRARDAGMDVVYEGIRLTPAQIARSAIDEGVHVIGLSILSGAHGTLVREVLRRLAALGLGDLPVVVGGIIPPEDATALEKAGVAAVYTPKDFELNRIMSDVVRIVERANGVSNL